jgi:IS30 family transposase
VKLIPQNPAGRTNRRARAFSDEIARLHREGYSHAAIQRALADAGVNVSTSTVQRELARTPRPQPRNLRPPTPAAPLSQTPRPTEMPVPSKSHVTRPDSLLSKQGSPREIAEAFVKSQITNPLFKNRS